MFDGGWTTRRLADGIGLFPPGGIREGSVRIRDRRRPLRTARAVRDAAVAAIGNVKQLGCIERTTTNEGELAAVTTSQVEHGQHCLGVIFGDDFYTQIDVFTADFERFERYREIATQVVLGYSLGLGNVRMRRPFYQPPKGWSGYPRGLTTVWYAPGFPGVPTAITVSPAIPVERSVDSLSELCDQSPSPTPRPLSVTTVRVGSLDGVCAVTVAGNVSRLQLTLHDNRFRYAFQLETSVEAEAQGRAELDRLLATFEPISVPRRTAELDAFSCWA